MPKANCQKPTTMSDIAVKLENISKQYRLGVVGTGTLSHDLNRWFARVRGKEDPTLKIGQSNQLAQTGGDYVWALKDINLEIKKGEILGIIGKNGAGKSTLLKLLSRVTGPTTGQIKVNGRIASLLEVGTGFHPELTGRENIFLNGAILGMRNREIKKKLDEIVDFAGVAKYLDTPVKRYSSGMYVRLAFAVAAHLEPDILVVDEVLAVGDAEFQKKAIGKMQDVSKGEGRTVLFVSHNMNSIKHLCQTGILLNNGKIIFSGESAETVSQYTSLNSDSNDKISEIIINPSYTKPIEITYASLVNKKNIRNSLYDINEPVICNIEYFINERISGVALIADLYKDDMLVFRTFDSDESPILLEEREPGHYQTKLLIPRILKAGVYSLAIQVTRLRAGVIDILKHKLRFTVDENSIDTGYKSYAMSRPGFLKTSIEWQTIKK